MRALGLILLIGGFIGLGFHILILPLDIGTELDKSRVSLTPSERTTITLLLQAEDAPLIFSLVETYSVDQIDFDSRFLGSRHTFLGNRHNVTITGPDGQIATGNVVMPSSYDEEEFRLVGDVLIAESRITLVPTIQTGEYTIALEVDHMLEVKPLSLDVVTVGNAHPFPTSLAQESIAAMLLGTMFLIAPIIYAHQRSINGAPQEKKKPVRRWGRS